ncbi:MAG: PhoH family protein [Candidatus Latescibacteria bacterium]|nr:PhoH family protein [Candidatus Latescibacterota bacterium]
MLRNPTLSHQLSIQGVDPLTLYGHNDVNLLALEARYGVHVTARGETVTITGPAYKVRHVSGLLEEMVSCLRRGDAPEQADGWGETDPDNGPSGSKKTVLVTQKCDIRPRSAAQHQYVTGIENFDIVFGIGPAGTGKTYLAVACAAAALKRKEVSRIILTRPAVEAGENLGFLPGDIQEKVDPYLRPLYDALRDMIPGEHIQHLLDNRTLEIAPLAFMRGRTLNNAFVILDEAQNTTISQMKMFLTRMGANSKAVVNGDVTQIDLPPDDVSGLVHVQQILSHIEAVRFVQFTEKDVVRHALVSKIISAYDRYESEKRLQSADGTGLDDGTEALEL